LQLVIEDKGEPGNHFPANFSLIKVLEVLLPYYLRFEVLWIGWIGQGLDPPCLFKDSFEQVAEKWPLICCQSMTGFPSYPYYDANTCPPDRC
jgi:hypothetical protein